MQNWGPNSIKGFTQATQEGPSMMPHKFSSEYNNLEFCVHLAYIESFKIMLVSVWNFNTIEIQVHLST